MTSTSTFQGLLARIPAFQGLSPQDIAWLASQAEPFHCDLGQDLLLPDRLPDHCFCVIEGRGRLLHHDPALRRPVTLAYCQPGDLVGWSGLVRREPCEWFTSAMPLKLVGISAETFYALEQRSEAFRHWLDSSNSPAELIQALQPGLRRRPTGEPHEREVLRRLLPHLKLVATRTWRQLPDDGAVWLWDSQPSGESVVIGAPVDPQRLAAIPPGESVRLLRIEAEAWRNRRTDSPGGIAARR